MPREQKKTTTYAAVEWTAYRLTLIYDITQEEAREFLERNEAIIHQTMDKAAWDWIDDHSGFPQREAGVTQD